MGTKVKTKTRQEEVQKGPRPALRKARASDVRAIHSLVNDFARRQEMIPRSLNEIYENLRDFTVCEVDGAVAGVCALHVLWEDLAEIRSLAVKKDFQGLGIGRSLVRRALREARDLGVKRVFALTYVVDFFKPFGFRDFDKQQLPQKIWGECVRCAKFPECDELAVIKEL
ncbi:MAG: N-acetyltransferase [Thermodesulfovibrionales bacterium]